MSAAALGNDRPVQLSIVNGMEKGVGARRAHSYLVVFDVRRRRRAVRS